MRRHIALAEKIVDMLEGSDYTYGQKTSALIIAEHSISLSECAKDKKKEEERLS